MSTTTTRLSLYKPASDGSELVNVVTDLNNNYDAIDLAMGFRIVTSSTRPSTPYGGQGILESDTSYKSYLHNGTSPASAGWVELPNSSATYGGQIWSSRATDATTYRVANTFGGGNTNPTVLTEHAAAAGIAYGARVSGDSQDRIRIRADGRIDIGPGSGSRDTNLYRSAADTLKTDDSFIVGSTIAVSGAATIAGAATIVGATTLTGGISGNTTLTGNWTVIGVGQMLFARKTADEQVTSSTTLQDDNHLTLSVAANSVYTFELMLMASTAASDITGDIKVGFTFPSAATCHFTGQGPHNSDLSGGSSSSANGEWIARPSATSGSTTIPYGMSGVALGIIIKGLLITGANAGSLTLQWAQNTSDSDTLTMLSGSWMRAMRVA